MTSSLAHEHGYELATDLTAPQPVDFYAELAAELHRIAERVATLAGRGLVDQHVTLTFYPWGASDAENVAAIDAIGTVLLDKVGSAEQMGSGTYHHDLKGHRGPVSITAYRDVEAPEKRELVDELAALRAQVEAARAERDALGGQR